MIIPSRFIGPNGCHTYAPYIAMFPLYTCLLCHTYLCGVATAGNYTGHNVYPNFENKDKTHKTIKSTFHRLQVGLLMIGSDYWTIDCCHMLIQITPVMCRLHMSLVFVLQVM